MPDSPVLHTTEIGSTGPRVVFLHGLFGQGKNFATIARALEPAHRSLLVDLPNHGASPWTEHVDQVAMADAVAATIRAAARATNPARHAAERADAGRVDVVGHSLGGKVAMLLALRHPDLVRRLVVVDIAPGEGGGSEEFAHLLDSLRQLDLTALATRAEADAALAGPIPNPTVRGFLLQNLRRGEDGGWQWRANLDLLRAELARIGGFPDPAGATFDGRVLWIAGERSPYVTPQDAPAMRALFPRVRSLTVKEAGHWVHSERPDVVTEALRFFLGRG